MKIQKLKLTGITTFCLLALVSLALIGCAQQKTEDGRTLFSASNGQEHALTSGGWNNNYNFIQVEKTGDDNGDNSDFYGTNAAVFATDGGELSINDAIITTNGSHANAVFSYGEGSEINIENSKINTESNNSGGIMVTGGGSLNASNLDIETQGGSSAAIRSDKGGGVMNVDGGKYVANGSGSPAIYSTAEVNVSNADLQGTASQAVVIEGGNSVYLEDCNALGNQTKQNSDKTNYTSAVMIYQSMSGDASDGDSVFTMNGGTLTSKKGDIFFVTNVCTTVILNNVKINYADNVFLRACAAGWGKSGSNGGHGDVYANNQNIDGNVIVDADSAINLKLSDRSTFNGAIENSGKVYVELTGGSTWTLTADCTIDSLTCEANSINLNGHTLTVGGNAYVAGTASTGQEIDMSQYKSKSNMGGGMNGEGGMGGQGGPGGMMDGEQPPELPDGEGGMFDGDEPPAKPDGEDGMGGEEPPAKPDGDDGGEPPAKPDGV